MNTRLCLYYKMYYKILGKARKIFIFFVKTVNSQKDALRPLEKGRKTREFRELYFLKIPLEMYLPSIFTRTR